jgi:hypothetical protein
MIFSNQVMDVAPREPPPPSEERKPPPPPEEKEAENFKFRLQGCVLSKGDIICDFTVTNTGRDTLLTFRPDTSVFDNSGGKYKMTQAWVGNKMINLPLGFAAWEMISDLPVEIRLVFSGLPQGTRQIPRLIVAADRGSLLEGRRFSMRFQDIALSRR